MRLIFCALLVTLPVIVLLAGCGEKPIGQPCQFSWPENAEPDGTTTVDCNDYPACSPLQDKNMAVSVNNQACPEDCLQLRSIQCDHLICVATQIGGNPVNMNGHCSATGPNISKDCPNSPITCGGYCTKDCLSDASCPKGYRCNHMAPFGGNLQNCDIETDWDTKCTTECTPVGQSPSGETVTCPSSQPDTSDYSVCADERYSQCCTCICLQFCPLLTRKFCRKITWDSNMFPDAISQNSTCAQTTE